MPVDTALHSDGDVLDLEGERPFTSKTRAAGSQDPAGSVSPGPVLDDPYDDTVVPVAVGEDSSIALPTYTAAAGNLTNFVITVTAPANGNKVEASVFVDDDAAGAGRAGEFVSKKDWVVVTPVAEVQTIELNDIGAGDTFKLTYNGHESVAITYGADIHTDIQDALVGLVDFVAGDVVCTQTDNNTYVLTFDTELGDVTAVSITSPVGFTPTGVTQTTAGVSALVFGPADGIETAADYVVVLRTIAADGRVGPPGVTTQVTAAT